MTDVNIRRSLTPREMQAMLLQQSGLCFRCKNPATDFIAEHWFPVALGNDQKPDCLLCVPCAKHKTNGLRGDLNMIAHIKRIRDARTQYDKRLVNGSRLRSRGFTHWRGLSRPDIRGKGQ